MTTAVKNSRSSKTTTGKTATSKTIKPVNTKTATKRSATHTAAKQGKLNEVVNAKVEAGQDVNLYAQPFCPPTEHELKAKAPKGWVTLTAARNALGLAFHSGVRRYFGKVDEKGNEVLRYKRDTEQKVTFVNESDLNKLVAAKAKKGDK